MPYGSIIMLHLPPTKVLISKPLKKTTTQESHKRAYLSENGGLCGNRQENGPKAEKGKTERATGLGRRPREEI